eukprot:2883123-Rhodomonas_salina.1
MDVRLPCYSPSGCSSPPKGAEVHNGGRCEKQELDPPHAGRDFHGAGGPKPPSVFPALCPPSTGIASSVGQVFHADLAAKHMVSTPYAVPRTDHRLKAHLGCASKRTAPSQS